MINKCAEIWDSANYKPENYGVYSDDIRQDQRDGEEEFNSKRNTHIDSPFYK